MQACVDARLLSRSPSWYRTPRAQSAALGVVFFWVFAAYTTIQFYSASTYGAGLAADAVSAVYAAFTMTCLFSPGVVNKWGCRRSMLCGILGYGALVLSSMIYFLYGGGGGGSGDDGVDGDVNGGGRVVWTRRLVVAGGAVLGCGASTLWTAQGRSCSTHRGPRPSSGRRTPLHRRRLRHRRIRRTAAKNRGRTNRRRGN